MTWISICPTFSVSNRISIGSVEPYCLTAIGCDIDRGKTSDETGAGIQHSLKEQTAKTQSAKPRSRSRRGGEAGGAPEEIKGEPRLHDPAIPRLAILWAFSHFPTFIPLHLSQPLNSLFSVAGSSSVLADSPPKRPENLFFPGDIINEDCHDVPKLPTYVSTYITIFGSPTNWNKCKEYDSIDESPK